MVQTVSGEDSAGVCKEEFQAFFKWFLVPMAERAVEARLAREENMEEVPKYEASDGQMHTLREILSSLRGTLRDLYASLQQGLWSRYNKKVPTAAYKPTDTAHPYLVSMDNGPVHSFWDGAVAKGVHLEQPGLSLLQMVYMSPHGHDQHQIVEHTIGVVKRKARRQVRKLAGQLELSPAESCRIMYDSVMQACGEVTGSSISNGLLRMWNALRQVAAPRGTFLNLVQRDGSVIQVEGTAGSYASRA